jgi:hypothetical protein
MAGMAKILIRFCYCIIDFRFARVLILIQFDDVELNAMASVCAVYVWYSAPFRPHTRIHGISLESESEWSRCLWKVIIYHKIYSISTAILGSRRSSVCLFPSIILFRLQPSRHWNSRFPLLQWHCAKYSFSLCPPSPTHCQYWIHPDFVASTGDLFFPRSLQWNWNAFPTLQRGVLVTSW